MSRPLSDARTARPVGVFVIAAILAGEGLGLLAAAGWYVYGLATSIPASWGSASFMTALLIASAVGLLAASLFEFRGYRWTRAPALVFQILVVVLALPLLTAGIVWPGLIMIVPAVVVVLLLFTRPVVGFLIRTAGMSRVL